MFFFSYSYVSCTTYLSAYQPVNKCMRDEQTHNFFSNVSWIKIAMGNFEMCKKINYTPHGLSSKSEESCPNVSCLIVV